MVDIAPTAIIGHLVFANEVNINGKTRHAMYAGELRHIPSYINIGNCQEFGLSKASVDKCTNQQKAEVNYDYATSVIDTIIPVANEARYDIYALIIGNQNYRFAANSENWHLRRPLFSLTLASAVSPAIMKV